LQLEFLVKWKRGDETWDPFQNVAETEALGKYERLHGTVPRCIYDVDERCRRPRGNTCVIGFRNGARQAVLIGTWHSPQLLLRY
jgi:hypothetical protein